MGAATKINMFLPHGNSGLYRGNIMLVPWYTMDAIGGAIAHYCNVTGSARSSAVMF